MRVLALGCTLPDSQVDNYDWASALSFFDYDAIVVDPAEAVSQLIEGVAQRGDPFMTYADEPIEDGPSSATAVGLADLLRRRRDETERLLARGGLVVCFAYPDVAHPRVAGFTGAHRYYWLPAPTGADYGSSYLKPGSGTAVKASDFEHPFAAYLEQQHNNVLYRAVFAEGAAGFTGAKVIGRSTGGAAVSLDVAVGGGRIIFLPALPPRLGFGDRAAVASSIVTAIRNTLLTEAEDNPPAWIDTYALPGIEEAETRIAAAEEQLATAETEATEARNQLRAIDRYRRLLWQEGKYGLDLPVRDALALLGLTSYARPDEPATAMHRGDTVLVESEGSSGAIGMDPHYRLRERLESKIAADGRRAAGLIVINGHRETMPADRPQQYEDSLRVAAESMRYCVLQATDLFAAVRDQLEGKGNASAFLDKLIATDGVFVPDAALEAPAPTEAPVKE